MSNIVDSSLSKCSSHGVNGWCVLILLNSIVIGRLNLVNWMAHPMKILHEQVFLNISCFYDSPKLLKRKTCSYVPKVEFFWKYNGALLAMQGYFTLFMLFLWVNSHFGPWMFMAQSLLSLNVLKLLTHRQVSHAFRDYNVFLPFFYSLSVLYFCVLIDVIFDRKWRVSRSCCQLIQP